MLFRSCGLLGTDGEISKHSDIVAKIKKWVDEQYENGRQTAISDGELAQKYSQLKED